VTIKKWLAGGAMLAVAGLPAVGMAPASTVLASNGEIVIGTTATNGDIRVGGVAANDLGPDNQQAKHVSSVASEADPGPNQAPPPTIRD
jgi:hypothetical protein